MKRAQKLQKRMLVSSINISLIARSVGINSTQCAFEITPARERDEARSGSFKITTSARPSRRSLSTIILRASASIVIRTKRGRSDRLSN